MAGFEDLIRETLAKQGEPTHANRARVYASARSALERMVTSGNDADAAQAQREQLEAAIERIEDEHAARISPAPSPSAPPPVTSAHPSVAPVEAEPVAVAPKAERHNAKRAAKLLDGRPKRRPFAKLLLWAIILAGLATIGWWAWSMLDRAEQELGPVPNPVQLDVPSESGSLDGGWQRVFDPTANIAAVATGENASSEIVRDGEQGWLRFASSADPESGRSGEVRVAVPPGIMNVLAGRRATFELTVRTAPGSAPHAFSVVCDFTGGACNRNRFDAQPNAQSFLFVADLAAGAASGELVFDTDLERQGRAIDLAAIRVNPQ